MSQSASADVTQKSPTQSTFSNQLHLLKNLIFDRETGIYSIVTGSHSPQNITLPYNMVSLPTIRKTL